MSPWSCSCQGAEWNPKQLVLGERLKCITTAVLISFEQNRLPLAFPLLTCSWVLDLCPISHPLLLISFSSSPHPFTSIRSAPPSLQQPAPFCKQPRCSYVANLGGDHRAGPAGPPRAVMNRDPSLAFVSVPGSQTRPALKATCVLLPNDALPTPPQESSSFAAASSFSFSLRFYSFFLTRFSSFPECGLRQPLAPGEA